MKPDLFVVHLRLPLVPLLKLLWDVFKSNGKRGGRWRGPTRWRPLQRLTPCFCMIEDSSALQNNRGSCLFYDL